ncbi:hypothetical protein INR49_021638, partial [Caranx melampygus]
VKVNFQQVADNITCSSEGIYPEPQLTWSTSPPSNVTFKNQTKVQKTEQLLYTISGSLILSDTDLNYSCTISTRSNWRRVTLLKTASINTSDTATISCSTSVTSVTGFSLTWRFNHSQIILTQTRADVPCTVSEEWKQQVKGVSESGSLMLQDLSSHHEGTYTCELSDAEETLISNTVLRIEGSSGQQGYNRGQQSLMLQDLSSHHEGTYTCELSDAEETLISNTVLRIEESPHEEPSKRIYPEPELTCSTSPPSSVTFKNQTKVQETEQLLYTISGSLILSDTDLIYSCNISTRSNWRRVTFLKTASISRSYHGATIPCTTSITSITGFSLTWRYNHSQIILTQTRADVPCTVSEEWKQQVKGVSESGSLMLQNLSSHHEGTYTCELSDAEETLITNTVLRIEGSPHEEPSNNSTSFGGIIGGVTAAVAVILGGLVLYRRRKQGDGFNVITHLNIWMIYVIDFMFSVFVSISASWGQM